MRVLNTNIDPSKQFRRFSLPGFRSGSMFKKTVALFYYFSVLIFMCSITITYMGGKLTGVRDVLVLVAVELSILLTLLTPVIAIGYSNYYDWHGIKLFLIIMVPICIFSTLGQWLSTMFSIEYIESVNPSEKHIEEVSDVSITSASDDALSNSGASVGDSE